MNKLWLGMHFHRLPLEVFPPTDGPAVAFAQHWVVTTNAAAEEHGVTPGMRLASAISLAPGLRTHERSPAREAATMRQLACWAGGVSPQVCLAGEDELLIEIGGCLRLFGGLRPICQRVQADIATQGFSAHLSLAPTPQAAQWLARAGRSGICLDAAQLRTTLAPLGIDVLRLTQAEEDTLTALGVKRLADLFALPRAGLARRIHPTLVLQLMRALHEEPDPRPVFAFPETFAQALELPAKVEQAPMLLFAARRLLAGLAGWLSMRTAGITGCTFELIHEYRSPTLLTLNFADVTSDLTRMETVLRERLERCTLPAAVTDLRLTADTPVHLSGATTDLFARTAAQALAPVIERLRARLGVPAVHGLAVREDHRPELATRRVPQGASHTPHATAPRPLWLLPTPRPLQERPDGIHDKGPLRRLAGPERIESGWWDQGENKGSGDLRRDYYVATSDDGEWLWIFRDEEGWWLQGYFA